MLMQLGQQFEMVHAQSDFSKYELIVLPDSVQVDSALAEKLQGYLAKGGKLLVSGSSGLNEDATQILLPLGIEPQGFSPFTTSYFRFTGNSSDHVMYERGVRALPAPSAEVLAGVVEPYFERAWNHFTSHHQTPPERLTNYAAATLCGSVGYINSPVFSAFALHGNLGCRELVKALLARLLPESLARLEGPSGAEIVVNRQAVETLPSGERTVVHLLFYPSERRAEGMDVIEDILSVTGVKFAVKLSQPPARAYLAPEGTPVEVEYREGYAHVVLPELHGHAMVVME
jgi:hypothetical protein